MKSREKICISFLVVLMLAISSLMVNIIHSSVSANASVSLNQPEAKIISNASLDSDYDDESVIVVLNKEKTFEFKTYTPQDFTELNCYEVIDLTWQTSELVKKQLEAERTGALSYFQDDKDSPMLVDKENFRRILKLKVKSTDGGRSILNQQEENYNSNKEFILNSVKSLESRSDLIYVGPNYIYESAAVTPNDIEYKAGNQWAIESINLPEAWHITTGSSKITVGVIDTGIEGSHEDLKNQVKNDLHRVFKGAKATSVNLPSDSESHGTHVAGIIGAESNNSIGVTGTCWDVNIVSLAISEDGAWFSDNAILAVDHATANNIRVLNYSGYARVRQGYALTSDPAFEQSIKSYPGLFITIAGNDNKNNDKNEKYPANYSLSLDNVISVGAIDSNNQRADFSAYGEKSVNIYAPGVDILSTVSNNSYAYFSGTSMAAPHVTGVAALLLSVYPALTAAELKEIILSNADDITISTPEGNQNVKKLNAYKAIKSLSYNVIFDKQEGYGGNNGVYATFGKEMPSAEAPIRDGYTFNGYFSQPNGNGTKYYEPDMSSVCKWDKTEITTLYAYWIANTYTVTLHQCNRTNSIEKITVAYGETMPTTYRAYAPGNSGYEFVGYFSGENGTGTQYYGMKIMTQPHLEWDYTYYEGMVPLKAWDKHSDGDLYAHWKLLECDYEYNNIAAGEDFLTPSSVHLVQGENREITAATFKGYSFSYFQFDGRKLEKNYNADDVYYDKDNNPTKIILKNVQLKRDETTGEIIPKHHLSIVYEKNCVAAGTLITLADGSRTAVENLTGDEMLLVWNLYTGTYDTAPILFIDSDPLQLYNVINLSFSDGTTVKVISEHGFWDYDLNKYVYLDENAGNYIGHWFNKGDERVQLVGVEINEEYTTAWSPVTYGHLCYFVNGMLSMPGGIDGLFNIFDVDAETMKYDEASMQSDIETYGLFTYEEFCEYFYLPEEAFEAFNGQYMKVAIGKGLISMEELASLYDCYSGFLG